MSVPRKRLMDDGTGIVIIPGKIYAPPEQVTSQEATVQEEDPRITAIKTAGVSRIREAVYEAENVLIPKPIPISTTTKVVAPTTKIPMPIKPVSAPPLQIDSKADENTKIILTAVNQMRDSFGENWYAYNPYPPGSQVTIKVDGKRYQINSDDLVSYYQGKVKVDEVNSLTDTDEKYERAYKYGLITKADYDKYRKLRESGATFIDPRVLAKVQGGKFVEEGFDKSTGTYKSLGGRIYTVTYKDAPNGPDRIKIFNNEKEANMFRDSINKFVVTWKDESGTERMQTFRTRDEAQVFVDKNTSYTVTWQVGVGEIEKRSFKTQEEADKFLAKLRETYDRRQIAEDTTDLKPMSSTNVRVDTKDLDNMDPQERQKYLAELSATWTIEPHIGGKPLTFSDVYEGYENMFSVVTDKITDSIAYLQIKSTELGMMDGKQLDSFVNYLGSVVLKGTRGAYEGVTALVRPASWANIANTIGYITAPEMLDSKNELEYNRMIYEKTLDAYKDPLLAKQVTDTILQISPYRNVSQEYIDIANQVKKALGKEVASDPLGFVVEVVGGIVGGYAMGKALTKIPKIKDLITTKKLVQVTHEGIKPIDTIDEIIPYKSALKQRVSFWDKILNKVDPEKAKILKKITTLDDLKTFETTLEKEAFGAYKAPKGRGWRSTAVEDAYNYRTKTVGPANMSIAEFENWLKNNKKYTWAESSFSLADDVAKKGGTAVVMIPDLKTGAIKGYVTWELASKLTDGAPEAFMSMGGFASIYTDPSTMPAKQYLEVLKSSGVVPIIGDTQLDEVRRKLREDVESQVITATGSLVKLKDLRAQEILTSQNIKTMQSQINSLISGQISRQDASTLQEQILSLSQVQLQSLVQSLTSEQVQVIVSILTQMKIDERIPFLPSRDKESSMRVLKGIEEKTIKYRVTFINTDKIIRKEVRAKSFREALNDAWRYRQSKILPIEVEVTKIE